jgi:hypothetical protein
MKVTDDLKFEIALKFKHSHHLMHSLREQFYFGSREVLLEYMKLPMDTILLADVQHGFPRMIRRHPSRLGAGRFPDLIWSEPEFNPIFSKKGTSAESSRRHWVIGAPWIYMRENIRSRGAELEAVLKQRGNRLLVFPHLDNFSALEEDRYLDTLLREFSPSAILLFNEDFLNPRIRQIANESGVKVECAGLPRCYQPTAYFTLAGGRHKFLEESFKIMIQYREVISIGFSTALVYAAELGSNIGIFDYLKRPMSIKNGQSQALTEVHKSLEEKIYPFEKNQILDNLKVKRWAELVLGKDKILEPKDLKEIVPFVKEVVPVPSIR